MFGKPPSPPASLPWLKEYEIGHELIDSQHRIFLMLINKLIAAIDTGVGKEHLFRVVNEVRKYAEFHFLSEENVMYECHYPGIKGHEHIHSKILQELGMLCERVSQGRASPEDVVTFLKSWLFTHIAHEDNDIAKYVKQRDRSH